MQSKTQLMATFRQGRSNMMIMLLLTAVNVALTIFESDLMFMFTAYFPYIAAVYANGLLEFIKPLVLIFGCLLPLAVTLLCWIMTGKGKYRWMNAAAVIFALDTVFMFVMFFNLGFQSELIMDYLLGTVFHIYVLLALFKGSSAGKKLYEGEYFDDDVAASKNDSDAIVTNKQS